MNAKNFKRNFDGSVDCEIDHPEYGWIPFTYRADDPALEGQHIEEWRTDLADQVEEEQVVITPWTPPDPPSTEELAEFLAAQRNQLLIDSDWTQGADVPDYIKLPYQAYRQALRDLTDQPEFPYMVTWPVKPTLS